MTEATPTLTTEQVTQQVHTCIKHLAKMDPDRALEQNGVGFNGRDGEFGHSLAERTSLSPKQAFFGLKMIQTYRRQLESAGLAVPPMGSLPDPAIHAMPARDRPPQPPPAEKPKSAPRPVSASITVTDKQIAIVFSAWPGEENLTKLRTIRSETSSKGWDPAKKAWVFRREALATLAVEFPSFVWPKEVAEAVNNARLVAKAEAQREPVDTARLAERAKAIMDYARTQHGIEPFDYQAQDTMRAIHPKVFGFGLFYRRGAGKTLPAIWIVGATEYRAVILCTKSTEVMWSRECEKYGIKASIFNWASQPEPDSLGPEPFILIGDESHKAKNWPIQKKDSAGNLLWNDDGTPVLKSGSMRAWKFLRLASQPNCRKVLCLTGTPFPNGRGEELFPVLKAFRHWLSRDRFNYLRTYCGYHKEQWGWKTTYIQHADQLRDSISDCVVFRPKAKGKPLEREMVRVDPDDELKRRYYSTLNSLIAKHQAKIDAGEITDKAEELVMLGMVDHAASVAKIPSVLADARAHIAQGGRCVIFAGYKDVAKELVDELVKGLTGDQVDPLTGEHFEARCGRISGDIQDPNKRQAVVDKLTSGEYNCVVSIFGAGQEGLNMQAANLVLLLSRTYVPGDADQAEGRVDRAGQKADRVMSRWYQFGQIDDERDNVIIEKQEAINAVEAGKRKTARSVKMDTHAIFKKIFEAAQEAEEATEDVKDEIESENGA